LSTIYAPPVNQPPPPRMSTIYAPPPSAEDAANFQAALARMRAGQGFGRRRSRRSSPMEFGKKRRKYMLPRRSSTSMEFGRRRRRCAPVRRRPAKRRVKGSAPCGGLRRKVCRSTAGCSYVSTRRLAGCKRKGGRKPAMPAMRVMGNELALRFGRRRRARRYV
jgi:hypothetical protein